MALHTVVITFVTDAPRQTIVDELTAHLASVEYEIQEGPPSEGPELVSGTAVGLLTEIASEIERGVYQMHVSRHDAEAIRWALKSLGYGD